MDIPYISTDEYLKILHEDPRYIEIDPETLVDKTDYKFSFLVNLGYYQEEHGLPYSKKIHCFKLKSTLGLAKYQKYLSKYENEVYFFFEEESRYTYSNSPEVYTEERLRLGLTEREIEEKGVVYQDYMILLERSCPYCGKTLEKGYIKDGRNIYFNTNDDVILQPLSKTAIPFGKLWSGTRIECYHCIFCDKFIFDNPKKK